MGICNVDQPLFAKSIKPAAVTTSQIGYVRLHGRNYQDWFREKAPRDDRYNYLYSLDELEPWITRIKEIARKTKESYVITNNHFRGQAVVNALEMKATLTEQRVPAPAPLFQKYPELANSAMPEVLKRRTSRDSLNRRSGRQRWVRSNQVAGCCASLVTVLAPFGAKCL